MESNKTVIITLSLSVLVLAAISTFLSLRQSGILGVTTTKTVESMPRPTQVIKPPVSSLCHEITGLYQNYCRPLDQTAAKIEPPQMDETAAAKELPSEGKSRLCGDLYKLTHTFCPVVTAGPVPTTVCKYGVNSFALDQQCTVLGTSSPGYMSARYACYDGTSGTISLKSCASAASFSQRAKAACEGHGSCATPNTTSTPDKPCTGDNDCRKGEYCRRAVPSRTTAADIYNFGVCTIIVDKPSPMVTKVPSPVVTKEVRPTSTPAPTGKITCGWCGTSCVQTNVKTFMACTKIAPPKDKYCVNAGGRCVVVSTVRPQVSVYPPKDAQGGSTNVR